MTLCRKNAEFRKEREDFLEKTEDNDRVDKRWLNSSGIIMEYIGREIIETYWNVNTGEVCTLSRL